MSAGELGEVLWCYSRPDEDGEGGNGLDDAIEVVDGGLGAGGSPLIRLKIN